MKVSILGFGGSALGGVFEDIDEDKAVESVHEAFRLGINFFDTSPYYGLFKAEKVLGKALKGLPRDEIIVATKVGRYGQSVEDFDFSADRVTTSVKESLERLNLTYVDIIQCHDMEFGDLDQIINETIPALRALKDQGLARNVGITGLPLSIFTYVLDRAPSGSVDTVLSYCHYGLNDTTLTSLIPYLREREVGIITASPLAMGLLTKQGPPIWHPAPQSLKDAAAGAADYAASQGVDIATLALKFALKNTDVSTVLVGMASPEQVRNNVALALQAVGLEETPDKDKEEAVLQEVLRILEPVKDLSWSSGKVSCP